MCHLRYDKCIPSIFYDHCVVNVRSASEHPLTALSHKISSNTDKIRRILFGIMKVNKIEPDLLNLYKYYSTTNTYKLSINYVLL